MAKSSFLKTMKFILLLLLTILTSCKKSPEIEKKQYQAEKPVQNNTASVPIYSIKVIRTIPHDTEAYTQGLFYHGEFLYESTGLYGRSSLRKLNPQNGEVVKQINFDSRYFCEGIALHKGKIYVITWENNTCFVFDLNTFSKIKEIYYTGEGWGITNYDENYLIQSDGTNILKVIQPDNFQITKTLNVNIQNEPLNNLNELENIDNEIWANIWMHDSIAVIDKNNGQVKYLINVSSLRNYIEPSKQVDVINGIAYESKTKRIFLTGKLWPFIFEVELEKP